MADNKGSSSNPTKGLVAHLDRNRSLQQDRLVGSSSTSSGSAQSFRSHQSSSNGAALDAAFEHFHRPRGMQLGGPPMGPANPIAHTPGAPAFRQSGANTAWADEFLQARSQPGPDPRPAAAQVHEGNRFHHPAQGHMNDGQMSSDATTQAWPYQHEPAAFNPAQREMATRQNHAIGFAGFVPPAAQYAMYPEQRITDEDRLAESAEQAMEAAFAAYDQDFQGAMDGWLAADIAGNLETHVQNIKKMEEMKLEDPMVSNSGPINSGPTPKPEVPASTKFVYDKAMMKHAGDIVTTLTNNGSDEVKAKMNGSSFQGLMRAIASGKAAVVDDNFIDTSTGEVIQDLVELSGVKSDQSSNDISNGLYTAADNTDSKGKGKAKMKSLDEEQEQEHKESLA